jgi:Protein of unknown function (DUF3710)
VFRRRRREEADRPGFDSGTAQDDLERCGDLDERDELGEGDDSGPDEDMEPGGQREAGGTAGQWDQRSGPWDGADSYPRRDRIDFGSLLVPVHEGIKVEVEVAEGMPVWVTILRGDSALQLMAFAAPKTSGLWEEVRQEFAEEVAKSGGDTQEVQGPFGIELHARLYPAGEAQHRRQLEPVRFLGVDGPRWFLRGMIRGPAARHADLARPLEELFADVVVVRGDHPAPPGDLLEIRLPDDARQALEEQLGQDPGDAYPNPFERGPEITETR